MSRTPTVDGVTKHLQRETFAAPTLETAQEAVRLVYALRDRPEDARLLAEACGWLWTQQQKRAVRHGR